MNIHREVHQIVDEMEGDDPIAVLAGFAGEVLASGDDASIADLADALSHHILAAGAHVNSAEAVLAMVRSYSMSQKMKQSRGPGAGPRRAYDTSTPFGPGNDTPA